MTSQTTEYVTHPGKFEGSGLIGEILYELSMSGFWFSDYASSPDGAGDWAAIETDLHIETIRDRLAGTELAQYDFPIDFPVHVVVYHDAQGFFDVDDFDTRTAAEKHYNDKVAPSFNVPDYDEYDAYNDLEREPDYSMPDSWN